MPFGFQRLNERQQRPNQNIVFIKPLEGPDKEIAQDFLERIAAIAAPITKANHLFVASLEEFPPNREFWGRNFNAGECIQLVLKSPTNGRWLPFRFVQMVRTYPVSCMRVCLPSIIINTRGSIVSVAISHSSSHRDLSHV